MAVEQAMAQLYRCDGCGSVKYGMPGEVVTGYAGTITRTAAGGTQIKADWWADTMRCIGNANKNSLRKALVAAADAERETKSPSIVEVHLPEPEDLRP